MKVEGPKEITKIVDRQFEMLGINMRFADIPEHGVVTYKEGKKDKKDYWYNVYKFTEEQEEEWRAWALEEVKKIVDKEDVDSIFKEVDMRYGFVRRYTKKGELF